MLNNDESIWHLEKTYFWHQLSCQDFHLLRGQGHFYEATGTSIGNSETESLLYTFEGGHQGQHQGQ